MKNFYVCPIALMTLAFFAGSCKKYSSGSAASVNSRKIRFQLYSSQDFSNNTYTIKFSIFIKDKDQPLYDSAFAPMLIKDLPDANHKLVVEKYISGYNDSDLVAGFTYEIENVGFSWYIDTAKAGNPLKVIDYDFH